MTLPPIQKFNDDLLTTDDDRKLAVERFPDLNHVLDFGELRDLFLAYDQPANQAKKRRRRVGFVAILLGVLALLGASAAPLYEPINYWWPRVLGGVSALLGVLSLLMGTIGSLSGEAKHRWLCNRLMTERLRQFHFQALSYRMGDVLKSMVNHDGQEGFRVDRHSWFAGFRLAYENHLPARLSVVLDDDAEEDFSLHQDLTGWEPPKASDANLDRIFSAYRLLRIEHQLQYANYKLAKDGSSFPSSPVRQHETLGGLSLIFILIVFVAHLAIALSLAPGWNWPATSIYVHLGIIWVVIGILAIRTLEEGLQPAREVERYTRYRSSLMSLLGRFDRATSPKDKLRIMHEVERTSYQEMRQFLKTHYEARYVL
jgi:cobalamin biosynthesis protein CobD/CbiB